MQRYNNIAAVYIRVSTDNQTEYSPNAQLKAIKEYAKKRNLEIDTRYIYKDEGISGRKAEKRPAFMNMIATAKSKPNSPFSVILVHKFDRFARNREDSIVYKSLLKRECKVEVISITEDFGDDKFSVILEAMLEAMAEYYSLNLSDEVKKGMTEKADRGEPQTKAPFGYIMKNKNLIIDEEKSKIVKMIYNDFLSNMGFQAIAKKLNNMLIRTNRNNKWEVRTIEYLLRNPIYKGYTLWTPNCENSWNFKFRQENGILKKGNFESIIEEEIFDKVQQKIDQNKSLYRYSKGNNFHWISKLVKCSDCGSTLTTQKKALQCIGYNHGSCNASHYITYTKICSAILEQIKKDFNNPINIQFANNTQDNSNNTNILLNEKIKKLNEKLIRCKNLYLEGIDSIEEFKKNKEEIEAELTNLKEQLSACNELQKQSTNSNFKINAKSIYNLMMDSTIDERIKYTAIHELIDYVIYDKMKETIEIFYKK